MNDYSLSLKVNGEYKTMINIKAGKYGSQLAFTPDFKPVLYSWLKSGSNEYLNFNIKDWGDKSEAAKPEKPKPAPVVEDDLDDSIPF